MNLSKLWRLLLVVAFACGVLANAAPAEEHIRLAEDLTFLESADQTRDPDDADWLGSSDESDCCDSCWLCRSDWIVPNMIGDSLLALPNVFRPSAAQEYAFIHRHGIKAADNNSAMPRNRLFYSFHHFSNVW